MKQTRGSNAPNRPVVSAGLLLYRRLEGKLEFFLAHPGGPFWAKKDEGAWTIPKGQVNAGEDLLAAACREFEEETGIHAAGPFRDLGSIRQKSGKLVHAWAFEGDADPAAIVSNTTEIEWPPSSGQRLTVPEIDRCAWFDPATARAKINPAQVEFLRVLEELIATDGRG
jgi:predicted NUDIX family NTP pyrophosphohydrolase